MQDKLILGIDISKAWIDVAIHGLSRPIRLDNTPEAITAWLQPRLLDPGILRVCYEATGRHEQDLETTLGTLGIPGHRLPSHRVTALRQLHGVQAKTDRLDARLLATYAAQIDDDTPRPLPDPILRERSMRRRQLVQMRHAEQCRLPMARDEATRADIALSIAALDARIARMDQAIAEHIRSSERLREDAALLRTFTGVGSVTTAVLQGQLPELGHYDGKRIAALVGLAPRQRDSGRHRGQARTGFGRPEVRRVLFNVARVAIQHNPAMKALYERLTAVNHRPGKVALVAVMRHILVTLNAMLRDRTPWKGAAEAGKTRRRSRAGGGGAA